MVLGIRGMPDVQGGVETHAEQLYRRLAEAGCDVEALVRTRFVARGVTSYGSVKLRRMWAPRRGGFEALVHSLAGVFYAGVLRPDILHIHSIGPGIVTPLARCLGLKVVVTYHSLNYEHEKWGPLAKWVLRLGEQVSSTWSNARIAVSNRIVELICRKYSCDAVFIPNGVDVVEPEREYDHVVRLGLRPGSYFLNVGRIAQEKRQLDLIKAYTALRPTQWKLALVGGADDSAYAQTVRAAASDDIVQTGFLKGPALSQLYSHAGGFILPSSHEGLPIALLEAMSFGLPVLASDIAANTELGLSDSCYFRMGDVDALAEGLIRMATATHSESDQQARREWVSKNFNWDRIAGQTLDVYKLVLGR